MKVVFPEPEKKSVIGVLFAGVQARVDRLTCHAHADDGNRRRHDEGGVWQYGYMSMMIGINR